MTVAVVRNAVGTNFVVRNIVKNSSGTPFTVSNSVRNSAAASFLIFTTFITASYVGTSDIEGITEDTVLDTRVFQMGEQRIFIA